MGLTVKQQIFVNVYLETFNATEAARQAGYQGNDVTLRSVGKENLSKPHIKVYIEQRLAESTMTANEVLHHLARQARGSMADFVSLDEDGNPRFDLKKAKDSNNLDLIKSIKFTRKTRTIKAKVEGEHDVVEISEQLNFELYDKQAALQLIGRHYALFTDKLQVEDWRSKAIDDIKAGLIDFKALAAAFDNELALELFRAAGVPVLGDGK